MDDVTKARQYNPPLTEVYAKTGDPNEEHEAQQAMIRFVTNPDGSTYVIEPIVPELFSALLKARYSRTELSAKQLLWREFVSQKENIPWSTIEEGITALNEVFNFAKAEGVAERILLQYGDDSVFELGGAHLFLDRVSMVASKIIEDARIGISPLEKSTRYVVFDQKDGAGDYSFFKDPKLMDSKFAEQYLAITRDCFILYAEAVAKFLDFYTKEMPIEKEQFPDLSSSNKLTVYTKLKDEKSIKAANLAYKASIRSKACDIARVLLPASTFTNIGEFGNARAYGYLFTKMKAMPLAESQLIANESVTELAKVLPKFFDIVDNDHGTAYQTYLKKTEEVLQGHADTLLGGIKPKRVERVTLVKLDKNPELNIAAALLYPYSVLPLQQIIGLLKKAGALVVNDILHDSLKFRTNRRHKPFRGYEIAGYELVYDILGNFGIYRDIHRQRALTQQRQRYTTQHGYDMPQEFSTIGLDKAFKKRMRAMEKVHDAVAPEFPEESQYLTNLAHYTRWYMGMNLRQAFWLTELRSVPQGHFSYRTIAQDMFIKAKERYPFLENLKPMEQEYVDMGDRRSNLERMEAMQRIQVKLASMEEKDSK